MNHGTLSCYQHHGCRRPECREAMLAYSRERRAKRPAPAERAGKVIRDSLEIHFYEAADGDPLLALALAADLIVAGRLVVGRHGLQVAA